MLVATTRGWTHGGQYKKRYSFLRMDQTIVICWVECRLVYNNSQLGCVWCRKQKCFPERSDSQTLSINYQVDSTCPFVIWTCEERLKGSFVVEWTTIKTSIPDRGIYCSEMWTFEDPFTTIVQFVQSRWELVLYFWCCLLLHHLMWCNLG